MSLCVAAIFRALLNPLIPKEVRRARGVMVPTTQVRITSHGKSRNFIAFVAQTLTAEGDDHVVVLTATGRSVAKAISVVEVTKSLVPGLHQLNELSQDEAPSDGAEMDEEDEAQRRSQSKLIISLSKSASALGQPTTHYGYQPPLTTVPSV